MILVLRKIIVIVFWLCCLNAASQNTFNVIYDNEFLEIGNSSAFNSIQFNSDIYSFGITEDEDSLTIGVILRYDENGVLEQTIKLDSFYDSLQVNIGRSGGLFLNENGGDIYLPYLEGYQQNGIRIWNNAIAKFTPPDQVDLIWHNEVDSMDYIFYALHPAEEGYYAVGQSMPDTSEFLSIEGAHGFLMKLDSLGNQEWVQFYNQSVEINFIDQNSQGEFILGSWDHSAAPFPISSEHLIIKTDAMGNEQWRRTFGGEGAASSPAVVFNENDQIVGLHRRNDGDQDYFPLTYYKLNDLGSTFELIEEVDYYTNLVFSKSARNIKINEEGDVFSVGAVTYYDEENDNALQPAGFLLKMDENLDSLWLRQYNYFPYLTSTEVIMDLNFTEDGGIVMVGESSESGFISEANVPNLTHIWTLKVDQYGCLEPGCELVGAEEIIVGLQDAMKVYPNPVQEVLNLQWNLDPSSLLSLASASGSGFQLIVVNGLGQIVQIEKLTRDHLSTYNSLTVSTLPTGHYTLHWMNDKTWLDSVKFIKE